MQKSMFEIKCSDCGQVAMVPFKPTADKPVYCKSCFSKHRFSQSNNVVKTKGSEQKQMWASRRDNGKVEKALSRQDMFKQSCSFHS